MEKKLVTKTMIPIVFLPAPDEASTKSDDYQRELGELFAVLRSEKILVTTRMQFRDAFGAGATQLGEFAIEAAKYLGPVVTAAFGAWLQKRYGRKVRLKIGDVEAEASTVEEVAQLLQQAEQFKPVRIDVQLDKKS